MNLVIARQKDLALLSYIGHVESWRQAKQQDITTILATYEMTFPHEAADRVCFSNGGRKIKPAPPEEIFTRPQETRTHEFLHRILT